MHSRGNCWSSTNCTSVTSASKDARCVAQPVDAINVFSSRCSSGGAGSSSSSSGKSSGRSSGRSSGTWQVCHPRIIGAHARSSTVVGQAVLGFAAHLQQQWQHIGADGSATSKLVEAAAVGATGRQCTEQFTATPQQSGAKRLTVCSKLLLLPRVMSSHAAGVYQ